MIITGSKRRTVLPLTVYTLWVELVESQKYFLTNSFCIQQKDGHFFAILIFTYENLRSHPYTESLWIESVPEIKSIHFAKQSKMKTY